jgi:glycogen operon protein
VSYNEKHNEANLDDNNDGEGHNRSWNCGVEGPTDDPQVLALRRQQQRNFIATLFLSQGVPMICHGDELGRTQQGNNNGYCQDNDLTWIDWSQPDSELLTFTERMSALRRRHPVFRRRRFFEGRPLRRSTAIPDIEWFTPDGDEMSEEDWDSGFGRSVGVFLNGNGIGETDRRGERITDDSFYLCFSAHDEPISFRMPPGEYAAEWTVVVDTLDPDVTGAVVPSGKTVHVGPRALVLLRQGAPE